MTGVSRATATRAATRVRADPADPAPRAMVPANRLTPVEQARVLAVLDSVEFVDQPPLQVYAALLAQGTYLCSVATMYRLLGRAGQVKECRRLARHPARVVPELVATGPGQILTCYAEVVVMPIFAAGSEAWSGLPELTGRHNQSASRKAITASGGW